MKSLNVLDFSVVGIYMLSMIVIGLLFSRRNKGDEDYFKGGNRVPWVMASLSFFISGFSAYMFVAASGKAYKSGISCLLLFTSSFYGFMIFAYLFAGKWRRTRITSPNEYIKMRYGNVTRTFCTALSIPLTLLSLGNYLYVLSIFISSALGLTGEYQILGLSISGLHLCIIAMGFIIVAYTVPGGLWAVVVTDTVQFIIVMVASIIILPLSVLALAKANGATGIAAGLTHFMSNPPTPDYFHLVKESQTLSFTFAWIALMIVGGAGNSSFMQRSYSVPDERAAKKMTILGAVLFLIAPIIWVAPVFFMRSLLPNMAELWPTLKNPDEGTYVTIALKLLPNGMVGLTVSAILAATMSTVSTVYNVISSVFTRDLYRPFIKPDASHEHLMKVGKWTTLGFGLASIFVGFLLSGFSDAFTTTFTIGSHVGIAFVAIAVGLLVRRIPWWTAIVSMTTCFATTLSIQFLTPLLYEWTGVEFFNHVVELNFQYRIVGAILANAVVFAIASRFYNPDNPHNKQADELFALLKKPVSEDENASLFIPDLRAYKVVAWVLAGFGGCMLLISILRITDDPQNVNLIAGLSFLALAALIRWLISTRHSPFSVVRKQHDLPPLTRGD